MQANPFVAGDRVRIAAKQAHLYDQLGSSEILRVEQATDKAMPLDTFGDIDAPDRRAVYLVSETSGTRCIAPVSWLEKITRRKRRGA